MSAVLIDSNVLLDVMTEDPRWFPWSAAALENAANSFGLVVNAIVYAEVSVRYSRIEDLEAALPKATIEREAIPFEAGLLAGKAFLACQRRAEPDAHRCRISSSASSVRSEHRQRD
jgi:predicted nucleic acid-binding protein